MKCNINKQVRESHVALEVRKWDTRPRWEQGEPRGLAFGAGTCSVNGGRGGQCALGAVSRGGGAPDTAVEQ